MKILVILPEIAYAYLPSGKLHPLEWHPPDGHLFRFNPMVPVQTKADVEAALAEHCYALPERD